ncbi:MAG TPA: peptide-methionine (S)-S-oxide reductase MsrA [Stenomitos sp.]
MAQRQNKRWLRIGLISVSALILIAAFNSISRKTSTAAVTIPNPTIDTSPAETQGVQTAVLAGGCFWGMESVFEHVKGVTDVISGFSGGDADTAHYERVGTGQTGHAEAIKITFNPAQVSYGQLLKVFFSVAHNPTELNRQGPDWGSQYRSVIFFTDATQQQVAQAYIRQLNSAHVYKQPIVTQVVPLTQFYKAEDYHQDFINRNPNYPYVVIYDLPKLRQLKANFPNLYKLHL